MRKVRLGCIGVLLLLLGGTLGIALCLYLENRGRLEREDAAINDRPPIRPAFLRDPATCQVPNPSEDRLDRTMIDMAAAAAALHRFQSPALQDAISYFAWHWRISAKDGSGRCAPTQALVEKLGPWLDEAEWPAVNTNRNDLQLAERLPRSAIRAQGLAAIAFHPYAPPQDIDFYDSRPLAMQLLADQGRFAQPWRAAALKRMEADSAIGTGAAQVAVAADPPSALPRVSQLMVRKLKTAKRVRASWNGRDVPVLDGRDANRLIELGYAVARGGPAARPYAQPVLAMLDQRIARPSPPFGLFAAPPTELCRVARAIGGAVAAAANRRDFCAPGFKGGDGLPRDR